MGPETRPTTWIVLLLGLIAVPSVVQGQSYVGKARRVIDGDTMHLLRDTGQIVRIELYGVDAPEWGQPYGPEAARAVRRFVHQERLRVVARGQGEDGRPLFVVMAGDRRLNDELLRDGLAWWDRQQAASEDQFRRLEHKARAAERGLWTQQNPVAPWTWRAQRSDGG